MTNAGLTRLAIRRALSWPKLVASVLVALFVALHAWGPSAELFATADADEVVRSQRALTRQGIWTVLVLWFTALFLVHAARTIDGWRRGEVAWRASCSTGAATQVASSWLGQIAALALVLVGTALVAESVAFSTCPAWRDSGSIAGPNGEWIGAGRPLVWLVEDPGPGQAMASVDVRVARGASAFDVRWRVQERAGVMRVFGRRALEVMLDGGRGPARIELEADRADDLGLVLTDSARLWRPGGRESTASITMAGRVALAGAAWLALALALGAWMRGGTATLLALALVVAVTSSDGASWLPGAELPHALAVLGQGRLPARGTPVELAASALVVVAGLTLARLGLVRWRTWS